MDDSIVKKYLELFFTTKPDLPALKELLTDDFCFRGPLIQASSADEYIDQLESVGSGGLDAKNTCFAFHDNGVVVLYELVTPFGTVPTTEWFWIRDKKIARIDLLNDPRPFIESFQ